jgi:hypothetical protein
MNAFVFKLYLIYIKKIGKEKQMNNKIWFTGALIALLVLGMVSFSRVKADTAVGK